MTTPRASVLPSAVFGRPSVRRSIFALVGTPKSELVITGAESPISPKGWSFHGSPVMAPLPGQPVGPCPLLSQPQVQRSPLGQPERPRPLLGQPEGPCSLGQTRLLNGRG
jgi:hypothetical protein